MISASVIKQDARIIAAKLRSAVVDAANDIVEKEILPDFERTVQTWSQAHRPSWQSKVEDLGPTIIAEVTVPIVAGDVYHFINSGTSVRYAVMTSGFQPKTAPGRIPAQAGAGGFNYLSLTPRPGIKARKFDQQIARRVEPLLADYLRGALRRALQ